MTINIQKATNVTAIGVQRNANAKPVFCITDGSVYASVTDAAEKNGVTVGMISTAISGKTKTCKGKRFCFISEVMNHLEEISTNINARNEKAAAYDAMIAEQNAKREAQANLAKHQANIEALRLKLEREMALMQEAQALCAN